MISQAFTLTLISLFSVIAGDSSENSLVNKTVIVTGGARGIGYAIADNFLSEGAKLIIILDKNCTSGPAAAETLNAKYGSDKAVFIRCHVYEDMHVWDDLVSTYDQIDVLVNNAGILNEYNSTDMVLTNVAGMMAWSFKFRDYSRTDRNGQGGTIMNIASRAGYIVFPFMSGYSATKYAIKGFTQNFGHEYNYKKNGVRVVAICPDFTDTEMTKQQMVEDDQVEVFNKLKASSSSQEPDAVGKAAITVYKTAASGTIWTVAGGELSEAPVVENITASDIESL